MDDFVYDLFLSFHHVNRSNHQTQALFLRHEGYLGVIGALMSDENKDFEWHSCPLITWIGEGWVMRLATRSEFDERSWMDWFSSQQVLLSSSVVCSVWYPCILFFVVMINMFTYNIFYRDHRVGGWVFLISHIVYCPCSLHQEHQIWWSLFFRCEKVFLVVFSNYPSILIPLMGWLLWTLYRQLEFSWGQCIHHMNALPRRATFSSTCPPIVYLMGDCHHPGRSFSWHCC